MVKIRKMLIFDLETNVARFARIVVKWDFLHDFRTLWHKEIIIVT